VTLPLSEAHEAWAGKVLVSRAIDPDDRYAVLAPTAGWGAKQWPADRYNEVAMALRAARVRVLVNAAGSGDETAKAVAREGAATVVTCTVGQMTALLRRASLVIGGDTGPVHAAAALGRPVLALFGPTDPARTGPYGAHCRVLRHATSAVDHKRHRETEAGLMEIGVDEVTEAALAMLREKTDG
jgi:heptosyltransferase-1